jgi:hypothetical protein
MLKRALIGSGMLLLIVAQARAERLYSVRVRTNPRGAVVYVDSREAGVRGTTPHRLRLPRGKHKIILEAPGHEPLETVIDVRRSDLFTFTLRKERPKARLRVVAVDPKQASGSTVMVNGKAAGALPANFTLPAGSHLIAVHKPGYTLWQQWVEVAEGEQRTLTVALVAKGPKTGTLLVASQTPGAQVFVDGKAVGSSPALIHKIPEGTHRVEVRAEGFPPKSKTIEVVADKTNKVVIEHAPTPKQPKSGTLRILTNREDVDIYLDGEFRGKSPVTVSDLRVGTHIAVGKLPGYRPAEQVVEISADRIQTVKLALQRVAPTMAAPASQPGYGTVEVKGTEGAQVRIDGSIVGVIPLEKADVTAGKHVVQVEMSGRAPWSSPITVGAGQRVTLHVLLQFQSPASAPTTMPSEPAVDRSYDPEKVRGLSSYGAQLVPPGYFTADFSTGFPYLAEGRLTTGIHEWETFAIDAGVELRTYGAFTEFDLLSKFRLVYREPLALAAFAAVGGGGGPKARDTFFMNAGLTFSLMFKKILTFTGRVYGNFYTDRHCPQDPRGSELSVCGQAIVDGQNPRHRYHGARLLLTGMLEVPITTHIGAFLLVEGAPFQDERMAFTDDFAGLMPDHDPRIYGRIGVTFKL